MVDLASALWNHRGEISRVKDRLAKFHQMVNWPRDLDLGTWIQLYAICLEFAPDLVLELGRGYGNSTCVFTEAANQLVGAKVVSIGYDAERAWSSQTALRMNKVVPREWFGPLHILEQDIFNTDFAEICAQGKRIFLFWDAHGRDLAYYVLGEVLPQLQNKRHIVVVHDISDARDVDVDPSYLRADGLPQNRLGDLVSPYEEIVPLYDFLSRNRIVYDTPFRSLHRGIFHDEQRRAELEKCWGQEFQGPSPLVAGSWIYFDMNQRHGNDLKRKVAFPEPTTAGSLSAGSKSRLQPHSYWSL